MLHTHTLWGHSLFKRKHVWQTFGFKLISDDDVILFMHTPERL